MRRNYPRNSQSRADAVTRMAPRAAVRLSDVPPVEMVEEAPVKVVKLKREKKLKAVKKPKGGLVDSAGATIGNGEPEGFIPQAETQEPEPEETSTIKERDADD
jgi:hypothetical protein